MLNSRMLKKFALLLSLTLFFACFTNTADLTITVPGAPTDVTATAGIGQVTVSWTAPTSFGGLTITGYQVTAVQDTSKQCFTTATTFTAAPTTCVVTGPTNGTAYTFTVTAINGMGVSAASLPSMPVTVTLFPFSQQSGKLVGTGAVGSAQQGSSIALSADGNTAIIGGFVDNSNAGAAWVWARTGGNWAQQGSKLVGTGASGSAVQGCSVALSADGNTAIIGGTSDNSNAGAAWVWTRTGGIWTQQGSKLVGTGAINSPYSASQGLSVALSSNGNTAIIGGPGDNGGIGATWVWTRSGGIWTQQGSKLVGTGAVGQAGQGYSVSLSSDGNTAIVGGPSDGGGDGGVGAVWAWTRSGEVWTQQGSKLVGMDAVGEAGQGYSVALSSDGNTAVVGGLGDNGGIGAVWVWTRSGGIWTQQGSKLVGMGGIGTYIDQGYSVTLSSDGNTAVVGGPWDNNNAGAVWVWTRSGGVWTQQEGKLVGTGAVGGASQGSSVALSSDGITAIIGGFYDNSNVGAAWVFTRN